MTLVSSTITNQTMSMQLLVFYDYVYSETYNLTFVTFLSPLDSETYSWSTTNIDYIPAEGKSITSQEKIQFNSPVTLSQLYDSLSTVTNKIGKLYGKSEDNNLTQFTPRYDTIAHEAKLISRQITKNLPNYNKIILENNATIVDDNPLWAACPYLCAGGLLAICALAIYFSFGLLGTFCLIFADEIAGFGEWGGCDLFCEYLEGQSQPEDPPSPFYASSVSYHGTISGNGAANAWNNILGPGNDDSYAEIYGGNYGDAAAIGVQLNEQTSGEIYLYGYSYSGYYSHIYVYVSNDMQSFTPVSSGYVYPGSPQAIDIGYASNFRYIYIAGFDDEGLSCRMEIDAISVVP